LIDVFLPKVNDPKGWWGDEDWVVRISAHPSPIPILSTCKRARDVGLKSYQEHFNADDPSLDLDSVPEEIIFCKGELVGWNIIFTSPIPLCLTRINLKKDILCYRALAQIEPFLPRSTVEGIQHIVCRQIEWSHWSGHVSSSRELVDSFCKFKSLKSISITTDTPFGNSRIDCTDFDYGYVRPPLSLSGSKKKDCCDLHYEALYSRGEQAKRLLSEVARETPGWEMPELRLMVTKNEFVEILQGEFK
jgi:hypothetical protein